MLCYNPLECYKKGPYDEKTIILLIIMHLIDGLQFT